MQTAQKRSARGTIAAPTGSSGGTSTWMRYLCAASPEASRNWQQRRALFRDTPHARNYGKLRDSAAQHWLLGVCGIDLQPGLQKKKEGDDWDGAGEELAGSATAHRSQQQQRVGHSSTRHCL